MLRKETTRRDIRRLHSEGEHVGSEFQRAILTRVRQDIISGFLALLVVIAPSSKEGEGENSDCLRMKKDFTDHSPALHHGRSYP